MEQLMTLTCTHCGKTIQIPQGLETFSCLYCGEKMSLADFAPREAQIADEEDRAFAEEHFIDVVASYPDYFRNFGRRTYTDSFFAYKEGIEPIFQAMNRYVCAKPDQWQALLDHFVSRFLQDWERFYSQDRRWKHRSSRNAMLFDAKLTLAWYTVPAILDLELPIGEDLTRTLHEQFLEHYPDNPFEIGTFPDISEGFRKKKLCFITTAVCAHEGKPDDCEELTAFRSFRDGWLSQTQDGRALIEEYYRLAPVLVTAMTYASDGKTPYETLRRDYLDPCSRLLQQGQMEECKQTYVNMVRSLQAQYHVS